MWIRKSRIEKMEKQIEVLREEVEKLKFDTCVFYGPWPDPRLYWNFNVHRRSVKVQTALDLILKHLNLEISDTPSVESTTVLKEKKHEQA